MEASVEGVWVFHARIYSRVVEVSLDMQIPLDWQQTCASGPALYEDE